MLTQPLANSLQKLLSGVISVVRFLVGGFVGTATCRKVNVPILAALTSVRVDVDTVLVKVEVRVLVIVEVEVNVTAVGTVIVVEVVDVSVTEEIGVFVLFVVSCSVFVVRIVDVVAEKAVFCCVAVAVITSVEPAVVTVTVKPPSTEPRTSLVRTMPSTLHPKVYDLLRLPPFL